MRDETYAYFCKHLKIQSNSRVINVKFPIHDKYVHRVTLNGKADCHTQGFSMSVTHQYCYLFRHTGLSRWGSVMQPGMKYLKRRREGVKGRDKTALLPVEKTPAAHILLELDKDLCKFAPLHRPARAGSAYRSVLKVLQQIYHFVERFLMQHLNGITAGQ